MDRQTESEWDDVPWEEDATDGAWDEEDEPTISCPYCRREIHEDSVQCPHCGQYISKEDMPGRRQPWWIIVGALLCLFVVWLWMML